MAPRNIVGYFQSEKMNRPISFNSLIERDFIYLLEFESDVSSYQEQPFKIHYKANGQSYHYTPDFYFIHDGREIVAECKPSTKVTKPENVRKFTGAQAWCDERESTFMVVTDRALRQGWRLRNIKDMHNYSRHEVPEEAKKALIKQLLAFGGLASIDDLLVALSPNHPVKTMITILHLGWHHEVFIPLDHEEITPETVISLPSC